MSRSGKKLILSLLFLLTTWLIAFTAHAQSSSIISKISELQISHKDGFYEKGLFPCQRIKPNKKRIFEDNNIFFTGLILYTLKSLCDSQEANKRIIIDSILNNSSDVFKYYKNRNGGITYNFYQTHPIENPFPNSKFLSKSKHWLLPDDFDDTSILYLAQNSNDSLNYAVKNKMEENSKKNIYTSSFKQYRKSNVYKTWFTKKMKQDIDICVLSNVLLFIFEKKLEPTSIDSASINLIKSAIQQNLHLTKEHLISAHYQNSAIILYHISRLISKADSPLLNELKNKVINDIHQELKLTNNLMVKVILLTSLFRLGEDVDFEINFQGLHNDMNEFYWFNANPFCSSRFWIKRIVGRSNIFHSLYRCEAYYWCLVLELEHLSNASFSINDKQQTTMYKQH